MTDETLAPPEAEPEPEWTSNGQIIPELIWGRSAFQFAMIHKNNKLTGRPDVYPLFMTGKHIKQDMIASKTGFNFKENEVMLSFYGRKLKHIMSKGTWEKNRESYTEQEWADIWYWFVNATNKYQSNSAHRFLLDHMDTFCVKLHFPKDLEPLEEGPDLVYIPKGGLQEENKILRAQVESLRMEIDLLRAHIEWDGSEAD